MRLTLALAFALAGVPAISWAQAPIADSPVYCSELRRVAALAAMKERFASIAGKPREGNFRETTLPLTGWRDCALYGPATYTCDSDEQHSADEAERTQARLVQQIKTCLGADWAIAAERSSASYVVLHDRLRPVSITLSTDETAEKKHIVHLILFARRS